MQMRADLWPETPNQQEWDFCTGERETVEHYVVESRRFEGQRSKLIEAVIGIIGRQAWETGLREEDAGILKVMGLWGSREEKEHWAKATKAFLVETWEVCRGTRPTGLDMGMNINM